MILTGSTIKSKSHAVKMARHLWKDENETIVVRENFDGGDDYDSFKNALVEMQLFTAQTKGNTGIFHCAISPRAEEELSQLQYEQAMGMIEKKLHLSGQARLRVDHMKADGRGHAHVFWSLVKNDKLIDLPFYKRNLQECADDMVQKFELEAVNRRPNEQTIEVTNADRMRDERVKKQVKETGQKIKTSQERKREIAALWEQTQTGEEFLKAVQAAGYDIGINETSGEASGRKRSRFVLMDENGEYNLARDLPRLVKTKDIRDRFDGYELPNIDQARTQLLERQHFDRNKYHAEWQEKIDKAGIENDKKQRSKEQFQRAVEKENSAPEKLVTPEKKEPVYDDAHLVALDREREWTLWASNKRAALEAQQAEQYKRKDHFKKITDLQKQIAANDNVFGRASGKLKALQKALNAQQMTLKSIDERIAEQSTSLEVEIKKNHPTYLAEQQRHIEAFKAKKRQEHEQSNDREQGYDYDM